MAISFVDCQDEHLPALREFFARVYRPDYILTTNEQFLQWQFRDTPNGKGNGWYFKLALLDGEIAGCLGYIPVEVSLSGQVVRGAWVVNWMVDPEQRRLGLGPFLMREVTRQFDVTSNVGPNQDARTILSRMGWINLGELPRYVCVLDVEGAGALTETGKLEWPLEIAGQLPSSLVQQPFQGVTVKLVDRFDDEATVLWDRICGAQGSVGGTRRSVEFLNWRYADHPVFTYRLLEARHQGRLIGLAVYRVEPVRDLPVRVGRLVELLFEEKEEFLLRAVLDDARAQGVVMMDFFCASQRFSAVLKQYGFLPGEESAAAQLPVLFQPIDRRRSGVPFMVYLGNVPEGAEVRDWYVTKSDGDQDRPN